jgi:predicted nucleic acid-binding protein
MWLENMSDVIFKTRVDDFLAQRVKEIIRRGSFRDEESFLRVAIEEMVRIFEIRELEEKIQKTSIDFAARHPMSISDSVLSARAEEDDEL